MWEYINLAVMHGWAFSFSIYAFVNLHKGWGAFKFYASLAIATLFFEALK